MNIPEESVEHMVTVLKCFFEDIENLESEKINYNRAIEYVKEWVKYRLPKGNSRRRFIKKIKK